MRISYAADLQIDSQFQLVTKTWLGATVKNNVSPRSYQTPNQFNPLLIDVNVGFALKPEIGLQWITKSGTNIGLAGNSNSTNINMFIQRYTKGNI